MRMNLSSREYKRIAAFCLLSVAIGLAAGYGASVSERETPALEAGRIGEECILPNTKLRLEVTFADCGHTEYQTLYKPEWIGITKEELSELTPHDSIALFSANEVCLVRVVDACCSEHLRLRSDTDGQLGVYQIEQGTLSDKKLLSLPIHVADMSESAAADMETGLLFGSMEEINIYLESMES